VSVRVSEAPIGNDSTQKFTSTYKRRNKKIILANPSSQQKFFQTNANNQSGTSGMEAANLSRPLKDNVTFSSQGKMGGEEMATLLYEGNNYTPDLKVSDQRLNNSSRKSIVPAFEKSLEGQ
jgi:hypothetical protein